ncbi:unnamed protein product [Heterobilharzia americana]|nr:unnamed protein product [Heterobilharzia americana]
MNIKKLIEQRAKSKITKEKAQLTLMIAAIYSEQGDHESALIEYKKYLEIWEAKEDNLQRAIANRYLAECYIEVCDFTQAIVHTNRYLQLSLLVDNKMEQQRAYVTLGRCFLNRVETLKDGPLVVKSLKSASQALLNSIKLIKDLSSNLDAKGSAEMRAVSLLNLGHVQRAQHNHTTALESFIQCITLAKKYTLQKILFRASYQAGEMLMNKASIFNFNLCERYEFLKLIKNSEIEKALEIIRTSLSLPLTKPYVDNEAKLLCINLKELFAQVYLCNGNSRKAIKIFRLLKIETPSSSEQYTKMMKKSFRLMNLLNEIPNESLSSTKDFITSSRIHEKLGDLYAGIDLQGCALRHYLFMLGFSELAYQHCSETESVTDDIVKLVDAALISVAETYRTLGYYDKCVEMYKREILWATTSGLSTSDMATSWLSLAQAQRLMTSASGSTIQDTGNFQVGQKITLNGSETVVDSLLSAHKTAKLVGSTSLILDCLRELLDYYEQYNYKDQAQKVREELKEIEKTAGSRFDGEENAKDAVDDDEEKVDDEEADNDKNTPSEDDDHIVTQFLESLSSDSELEQCIGNVELMDEFQDGMRGKKSGKALCLKTNMKGETPLHVAAINGDMDHVVKLIEVLGHPINVPDGAGWLPIHEAAFHDRSEIATYLLDHGASLDDPGYPDDFSTPLFEAIHSGGLTTALIFVRRGANLWHKNKQGEYLPNILDQWEPTPAIKTRLGDDYDRWCNLKREIPEDHSSPEQSDSSVMVAVKKNSSKSHSHHRRRMYRSPSLHDISEMESTQTLSKSNLGRKSLRSRNWNDLLVDLDDDEDEVPSQRLSSPVKSRKSTNAVESYREAMKAIGSSKTRSTGKRQSFCEIKTSENVKRQKKSSIIDADDDGWLVVDERPTGSRSVPSTTVKEHFETLNMKCGKSKSVIPEKNKLHPEIIDFSPHLAFTSTQNDKSSIPSQPPPPMGNNRVHLPKSTSTPVKTSKEFNQSFNQLSFINPEVYSKEEKPLSSTDRMTSVSRNNPLPTTTGDQIKSSKIPINECSGSSNSIKVAFPDISILVPVDSLSRSVSWLATEAYRRRQILMGFNSTMPSVDCSELVRLSTRDRALLLPSDRLYSVIPVLSQTGLIVELLAELTESASKYLPLASQSANQQFHTCHPPIVHSSQLNYESSHEVLSSFCRTIIDKARNTGVVDLSDLGIEDMECCKFLGHIVRSGARVITEIQLQGNSLTTNLVDIENLTTGYLNLADYLNQISSQIIKLNLSMNLFNEQFVSRLLSALSKQLKENESSCILMPRLQYLSLSYNPLLGRNIQQLDTGVTNTFGNELINNSPNCWTVFIEDILKAFPKLTYFSLAGCSLGCITPDSYDVQSRRHSISRNMFTDSFVSCLSELDLSWNPHISPTQLVDLFSMGSLKALRCLRLRGCSTSFSSKSDLSTIQCPTNLPLSSFELSSVDWLPKSSSKELMKQIEKFDSLDKPSLGDQLLIALCSVLIGGNIRLQILDMGHCQLTYHCLTSLKSLFGTPGASITTLIIDRNPMLRSVMISETHPYPSWIRVLQATAQSASALVSLTIDLPQLPDNNSDALTAAFTSVESKLLPALSPTPLQELVLVDYDIIHWTPDIYLNNNNNTNNNVPVVSNSSTHRFLTMLSNLFTARFGKMVKINNKNCRITFSIL